MADSVTTTIKPTMTARNERRVCQGQVVSDKGDKTITVRVDWSRRHSKYGKYIRRRSKLRVHDEKNQAQVGDLVEVAACRPISKTKNWRLVKVVRSMVSEA